MKQKIFMRALMVTMLVLSTAGCAVPPTQDPLEDFTLELLQQYRGKVVVLNFWYIACPYCRLEMPTIQAVYHEYRDKGVVMLAVNPAPTESEAEVRAFASQLKLTFTILRDPQFLSVNVFKVQGWPTTFFIDREGNARYRYPGAMDRDILVERIEALLQ
jgi:cytochrome c biogenesis protein CcmG/thiol:disulfide interchange protein DsbE